MANGVGDNALPDEAAALEADVNLTTEEGDLNAPAGAGLGRITISPDLIDGLSDMNVGDALQIISDAVIEDKDEDGNFQIALNSGSLAQGSPGTEEAPEDVLAGGFGAEEETPTDESQLPV